MPETCLDIFSNMRLILVGAADSILSGRRVSGQNQAAMADLETIRANYSLTDEQRQIVDHGDRMSRLSKKPKPTSRYTGR